MNTITEKVAENIKTSAPAVEAKVVEALVQREVNRRSEAIIKVMDQIQRDTNKRYRIKADIVTYNADGSVASALYSKDAIESLAKLNKQIEKMSAAVAKALEKEEYGDLYSIQTSDTDK